MSRFLGGSAYNMARDIAEGYYTTTARTFNRMTAADMGRLGHEIERYLRELRAGLSPQNDHLTNQAQNRKILRLKSALTIMRSQRQRRGR